MEGKKGEKHTEWVLALYPEKDCEFVSDLHMEHLHMEES